MIAKRAFFAALGVAGMVLMTQAVRADDTADRTFMQKAIQGNLAEIALGQLAQLHGGAEAVRQFGHQLVVDHSAANEKAVKTATDIGASRPTDPNTEQQAAYQGLLGVTGPTFDSKFAAMMVADHQKDIAAYEEEAKSTTKTAADGKNEARDYAAETLPTLQNHLKMAQSLPVAAK